MNLILCIILILFAALCFFLLYTYFFLMDEPSFTVMYRTIWRDLGSLFGLYLRILIFMQYCRLRNLSALDLFHRNVKKHPNKVCILFEDEEWTYKQIDDLANKIAHLFTEQGYQKGDEVALLMGNCPEYVCFWLGLGKIGVVTALINTNQKQESLAHSMDSIVMKGLIFQRKFADTVANVIPYIKREDVTSQFYCYTRKSENRSILPFACSDLNTDLELVAACPVDPKRNKPNFLDKLWYIYTSGTTGLPKAAIITHRKFLYTARSVHCLIRSEETRVIYNTLPLYHLAGCGFYTGAVLIFGGKIVIREKFSASNFWRDVVKYKASICVYIGEMCRYLLNQPKVPEETQHSVVMVGNGIGPTVWKQFQERFKVKKIIEVYSSTEGNINLANYYDKVGAIGILTRIFNKLQGVYLVKIHPETGEIQRNSKGFCIRCKPGEIGELVAKVKNSHPLKRFDGYLNASATKKKIIKNCFKKGEMVFSSGDLFVIDEDGYLFFKDRCGDTFRWKGENVSSTEVENILSKALNFALCVVYGVIVPDNEGRVGMAAIHVEDFKKIDFEKLFEDLTNRLPAYAVPAFLRFTATMEVTGTCKLKKVSFQEEGYNPEGIDDPLYVLDLKKKTYIPLTTEIFFNIITGIIKF